MKIFVCVQWALLLYTASSERVFDVEQEPKWEANPEASNWDHIVQNGKTWAVAASGKTYRDKLWEGARLKGCNFLAAMSTSDKEATKWFSNSVNPDSAESPFQNYPGDFSTWGYTSYSCAEDFNDAGPENDEPYEEWGLDASKKWPASGDRKAQDGANECIAWEHSLATTHDNQVYPATGAYFETIINTKDGIIIAWSKFGPANQGRRQKPPVTIFPQLKQWSDVAFLKWKGQGGGSNLRYIWSTQIQNEFTHTVIGYALSHSGHRKVVVDPTNNDPDKDPRWAVFDEDDECKHFQWSNRVVFSMGSDVGKALLGSPNGRGAGYMLVQHKKSFGEKRKITHVTFYCSKGSESEIFPLWEQNLIFHVSPEEYQEENNENDPLRDLPSL